MGSTGGWLGHSATVSKPGWKGSEERTEAMKAACLPQCSQAAAFARSSWGMQSSPSCSSSVVPRGLQVYGHQNTPGATIFKKTLSNSIQLPALRIDLSLPPRPPQPARYIPSSGESPRGLWSGDESMLELQPS